MKIRRYQETDHGVVWALHNLALKGVGAHPGSGGWDEDLHRIQEEYIDRGGEFLVGTRGGRIVAMGALRRSASERAEIKRMRVHPDCQRQGLGQEVLRALETRAAELGYAALHLTTTVHQHAARKLYAKSGYVEVGRDRVGAFDVARFEKALLRDRRREV